MLAGVGFELGLTGKLGRAWVVYGATGLAGLCMSGGVGGWGYSFSPIGVTPADDHVTGPPWGLIMILLNLNKCKMIAWFTESQ